MSLDLWLLALIQNHGKDRDFQPIIDVVHDYFTPSSLLLLPADLPHVAAGPTARRYRHA
jgi:hypothetical protein